jgi:hypothetical protein
MVSMSSCGSKSSYEFVQPLRWHSAPARIDEWTAEKRIKAEIKPSDDSLIRFGCAQSAECR